MLGRCTRGSWRGLGGGLVRRAGARTRLGVIQDTASGGKGGRARATLVLCRRWRRLVRGVAAAAVGTRPRAQQLAAAGTTLVHDVGVNPMGLPQVTHHAPELYAPRGRRNEGGVAAVGNGALQGDGDRKIKNDVII